MFLLLLVFLAAWPGIILYFLLLSAGTRWNKTIFLMAVFTATVLYSMTLGGRGDDRFGFGAFTRLWFWPCLFIGGGGGLIAQALLDKRRPWFSSRISAIGDQRYWLNSDIVFVVLLAFALPLYPLCYGWFAGISGPILFLSLSIFIALSVLGFMLPPWFNQAGRLNSVKIFAAASVLAWCTLFAYAFYTGTVVEARAREIANGAPYCQENDLRKLTRSWDMTILNMRQLRISDFSTEFHGELVVQRNGALERYHWSYRYQDFHGSGRVYGQSVCLREFHSDAETELRRPEEVRPTYVSRYRTTSISVLTVLGILWSYGPSIFMFVAHLTTDRRRVGALFVSTIVLLGAILALTLLGDQRAAGNVRMTLLPHSLSIVLSAILGLGLRAVLHLIRRKTQPHTRIT